MSGATNSIVNQHGGQPTITKKVNLSDGAPLPPDNSIASGSSRTTSSPWVRLLTAVAFTLLSAALAAGIAIAVMIFLLEMPIALGIVAIVALGAASLTAGGIALYNFFSGESDKNIPLIENPDTNDLSQKSQDSIQSEENQDSIQTGNDPSAIIPKNIINQDQTNATSSQTEITPKDRIIPESIPPTETSKDQDTKALNQIKLDTNDLSQKSQDLIPPETIINQDENPPPSSHESLKHETIIISPNQARKSLSETNPDQTNTPPSQTEIIPKDRIIPESIPPTETSEDQGTQAFNQINLGTNDLSQKSQDSIQSEENQDSIQTGNDPSAIIPKNIINQDQTNATSSQTEIIPEGMIISSDEKKPDQTPVEQPKRQSQNSTFSAKELSFDPIKLSRIDVKNQKVPRKVDVKTSSSEFSGYLHLILSYLREVNSHLETDANKSLAHKLCIYVKILLKTQETLNANWNEYSNGNMCNHTSTNAHIKAFNNLHSTVKLLSSIMQLVETRFSNYSEESKSKDSKNTLDQLDKKMGELESKLRQFGILVEGDISIPDIPQENSQIKPKSLTPANPSNNPINMNPASGETNSSNIRIEKVLPGQIDIRTKSGSVKNFDSLGKKKNSSTNQSNVADQPRGTTVVKPPQGNEITIVLKPPEK